MTKDQSVMAEIKTEPYQDVEQNSIQEGVIVGATFGRGELEVIEMRGRIPVLRKLHTAEAWLDKRFGIETTGSDRIPENERRPPSIFNVG
jgi:hypothetical protein